MNTVKDVNAQAAVLADAIQQHLQGQMIAPITGALITLLMRIGISRPDNREFIADEMEAAAAALREMGEAANEPRRH